MGAFFSEEETQQRTVDPEVELKRAEHVVTELSALVKECDELGDVGTAEKQAILEQIQAHRQIISTLKVAQISQRANSIIGGEG